LKKSPFEYMPVWRSEGSGLNPLLQNYWMTIHPPIMFVGFAGAVIPAAFAMTALVSRRYDTWAESARRWTLFAWAALGISLTMGGYWAYETLGWGGFWAWDPVENSSFIPWIFLGAQVHTLFIKRQRRGMMRFSLAIVLLTFWSVLYGTFLTRSGVLADFSVHSFVDLGINNFLIGGLAAFIGLGAFLLVLRWRDIRPGKVSSQVASRTYLVAMGIVVLFVGGLLVLIGTSAPLLTRVTDNPSAVGIPYYFATMTPVAIVALFLLGLYPSFKWNSGLTRPRLLIVGLSAGVLTAAVLMLTGVTYQAMYLFLFAAAVWALVANGYLLYASWRDGSFKPAYIAHVGLAIALVGAAVSAGFERKQTINLPMNQAVNAMGYQMTFTDVMENEKGYDCHVTVRDGNKQFVAYLPHEFPKNAEGVMRKPHVEKYLSYDFYLSPLALEQPKTSDPGQLALGKGESATIGKYRITFHDFKLTSHGEGNMTEAGAQLSIVHDGTTEDVLPRLRVTANNDLEALPVRFDDGNGTVHIANVRPDDGSVVLSVAAPGLPAPQVTSASLVVELSQKPLINLFWFGTIMLFASGLLSMRERRRKRLAARQPLTVKAPVSTSKPEKSEELVP
jgi:cytochrome c-type biogenesis protein CcmF